MNCEKELAAGKNICYRVPNQRLNFSEALVYCNRENSQLASIHSHDENLAILNLILTDSWVGLRATNNDIKWTDNSNVNFVHNKLNGNGTCAKITKLKGNWMHESCNQQLPFVCKETSSTSEEEITIKLGLPLIFLVVFICCTMVIHRRMRQKDRQMQQGNSDERAIWHKNPLNGSAETIDNRARKFMGFSKNEPSGMLGAPGIIKMLSSSSRVDWQVNEEGVLDAHESWV